MLLEDVRRHSYDFSLLEPKYDDACCRYAHTHTVRSLLDENYDTAC